jgi:hypothetical protein
MLLYRIKRVTLLSDYKASSKNVFRGGFVKTKTRSKKHSRKSYLHVTSGRMGFHQVSTNTRVCKALGENPHPLRMNLLLLHFRSGMPVFDLSKS